MSKQDVEELIDRAVQEAIAADVDVDEIESILDEKKERLQAVRAFQEGGVEA